MIRNKRYICITTFTICIYIYIYIYSEPSLQGDREECITQENDDKKIYENLKSPCLSILTCYCLKNNCHLAVS